jgi:hypothetical protein
MTFPDDLTGLFTAKPDGPASPLMYRQGTILAWDPITLRNTVKVGRTLFTDLAVLGVAEAASFQPGTVVGIGTVDSTWAILGRFVIPGTADATDAITQVGQRARSAKVAPSESTSSGTFTDLATPGPQITDVRIPASGKALAIVSATIAHGANNFFGAVGVEAAGPTTVTSQLIESLYIDGDDTPGGSRAILFDTLTPGGVYTFTAKYIADGFDAFFSGRTLTVMTL